nr:hypothetical protein [Fangzheng tombus-like virus]
MSTKTTKAPRRRRQPAPPAGPAGEASSQPLRMRSGTTGKARRPKNQIGSRASGAGSLASMAGVIGPIRTTIYTPPIQRAGLSGPLNVNPLTLPVDTPARAMASVFQRYYCSHASAKYVSAVPYTVGGMYVAWWDVDPESPDPPAATALPYVASSHVSNQSFPPTAATHLVMPKSVDLENGKLTVDEHFYYTLLPDNQAATMRQTVQAQFWLRAMIEPGDSNIRNIGMVCFEAEYWFSNPGLPTTVVPRSAVHTLTAYDWSKMDPSSFFRTLWEGANTAEGHQVAKFKVSWQATNGDLEQVRYASNLRQRGSEAKGELDVLLDSAGNWAKQIGDLWKAWSDQSEYGIWPDSGTTTTAGRSSFITFRSTNRAREQTSSAWATPAVVKIGGGSVRVKNDEKSPLIVTPARAQVWPVKTTGPVTVQGGLAEVLAPVPVVIEARMADCEQGFEHLSLEDARS